MTSRPSRKLPSGNPSITDSRITTRKPPFETAELNKALVAFFEQALDLPHELRLIDCTWGVYAFFDYDGEPIYVGQSKEKLSGRIRRHLTNRRTDAVAMSVLDPFEVYAIEVWPLPDLQKQLGDNPSKADKENATAYLNDLEAAVYLYCLKRSSFGAVLNEKLPQKKKEVPLPKSYKQVVVNAQVKALRDHPDTRIARRAATIARLAAIISERTVKPGLRRTLHIQALRLERLASARLKVFSANIAADDKNSSNDGDEDS